eukprot:3178735-Alexandrium_andersonii.AAC.1
MAMSKHASSSFLPGPTGGAMARAASPGAPVRAPALDAPVLGATAPAAGVEAVAGAVGAVAGGGASTAADELRGGAEAAAPVSGTSAGAVGVGA